jgi:hypothetical protein
MEEGKGFPKSKPFTRNLKPFKIIKRDYKKRLALSLKLPKREIFVTELFILSDPIWVGDLRNEPKKPFVYKC